MATEVLDEPSAEAIDDIVLDLEAQGIERVGAIVEAIVEAINSDESERNRRVKQAVFDLHLTAMAIEPLIRDEEDPPKILSIAHIPVARGLVLAYAAPDLRYDSNLMWGIMALIAPHDERPEDRLEKELVLSSIVSASVRPQGYYSDIDFAQGVASNQITSRIA